MKKFVTYAVIALGAYGYTSMTSADRDGSGAIVSGGSLGAFSIRVGDCFDDTSASFAEGVTEVTSLPAVPCNEPHDNEVFAVFDIQQSSFPQGDAMESIAYDTCLDRFESFVGRDYETSALDVLSLYPTEASWTQQGDREVVCAVYDMEANKLEGSAKGRRL
jgi:hypothetical protein